MLTAFAKQGKSIIRHAVWRYFRFTMSYRDVDSDGDAPDIPVQKRRHKRAALREWSFPGG